MQEARAEPIPDYAVFTNSRGEFVGICVPSLEYAQECARVNKVQLYSYNGERVKVMAKNTKKESTLEVTGVRVYPVKVSKKSNLLANVQIELNDEFVVTGLKVLDSKNGEFVVFPSEKWKDDEYHDIAFPITKEAREMIFDAVLDAYHEKLEGDEEEDEEEEPKTGKKTSRRR